MAMPLVVYEERESEYFFKSLSKGYKFMIERKCENVIENKNNCLLRPQNRKIIILSFEIL